jgi:hypothetical protein
MDVIMAVPPDRSWPSFLIAYKLSYRTNIPHPAMSSRHQAARRQMWRATSLVRL